VEKSLDTTSPGFGQPLQLKDGASVDARMVALMRCLLAFSALCIVYLDPPPPGKFHALVNVSIAVYGLFSVAVSVAVFNHRRLLPSRLLYWLDALFFGYLVALTGGISSVFFHFFFFAIVVASFYRGYLEGLALTAGTTVLFVVAGALAYVAGGEFELDRAIIRPIYLVLLGYMVSYWGGREITLRRRVNLLKDVGTLAFPIFGTDHAVHEYSRRLLRYFDAQTCLLVVPDLQVSQHVLYRAEASKPYAIMRPEVLSEASATALLGLPPSLYATCDLRPKWLPWDRIVVWEPVGKRHGGSAQAACRLLANLLECPSFATVPYKQPRGTAGRLFLLSSRRRFGVGETDFLAQVADQIAVSVNNAMVLDSLAQDAALKERSKISRDIHDSTVQSYIGLKLGLEALYRDLGAESQAGMRIKELLDMATLTVEDLRNYIDRLTGQYARRPSVNLIGGVLEQKRRYGDFHGIDVVVRVDEGLQLGDWVAGEAYQIVCEALSNVLRHTRSKRAHVGLSVDRGSLEVEVRNDADADKPAAPFVPRSINQRATSLGGSLEVRLGESGQDVVLARIPLSTRPAG
jgi:signal transduction histidine kinase